MHTVKLRKILQNKVTQSRSLDVRSRCDYIEAQLQLLKRMARFVAQGYGTEPTGEDVSKSY